MIQCPLCCGVSTTLVENLAVEDLIRVYRRYLKVDIVADLQGIDTVNFFRCLDCYVGFFYPAVVGSQNLYSQLQTFDWYYLAAKAEYNFAASFIKETDRVLEIGAGRGEFAKLIKTAGYVGLEFSRRAIGMARAEGVELLNESVEKHAVSNRASYDVVSSFQVLEHVGDIHSFIEACLECLKPGGILIFSVPNADSYLSIVENGALNMPPHHLSWWSEKALRSVASLFDLDVVAFDCERLANIHIKSYASAMFVRKIKSGLGISSKMLDMSFVGRVLNRVSGLFGRIYERGFDEPHLRPAGHSITMVYCKRGIYGNSSISN